MNDNMSRLFAAAYNTLGATSGRPVEPKTITSIAFAIDPDAMFSFDSKATYIHFTDGSIAELKPTH